MVVYGAFGKLKFYVCIPFELIDLAKQHKCLWDPSFKQWYTYDENHTLLEKYQLVYLDKFIFADKDYIKQNGGRYNGDRKVWYTYVTNEKLFKYASFDDMGVY